MKRSAGTLTNILAISLLIISCATLADNDKKEIIPFKSDGCSMFLDGPPHNSTAWLHCCRQHDFHYWMGGTEHQRDQADKELKGCVTKAGFPITGAVMGFSVKFGGTPKFATHFRWGYGWNYQREYAPLTKDEKKQIIKQLTKEQIKKYSSPLN